MIIPAIDILDGEVVRLRQGNFNEKTSYPVDPVSLVRSYATLGAEWIHIVDLSGARNPANRQGELIRRMMQATDVKLQVGGGVRSIQDVEELLHAGATRVVVGSLVIEQPDLVARWAEQLSHERILPAVDVKPGTDGVFYPVTHGWTQEGTIELAVLLKKLNTAGFVEVLMTDVGRDGMLGGPNISLYKRLALDYPGIRIQASGGVAKIDDVVLLSIPEISGVIVGRALLDGKITLDEARRCWQSE